MIDYFTMSGRTDKKSLRFAEQYRYGTISDIYQTDLQNMANDLIGKAKNLIKQPDYHGLFTPSGSDSNQFALQLAKNKSKVLATEFTHYSIIQACKNLDLEPILLKIGENWQVDKDHLEQTIEKYGQDIGTIVSTYGTTQLGHIEYFHEKEPVQQLIEDGAWLHIDAAYGGTIHNLLGRHPCPKADSITVDLYKFAGSTGASILLLKQSIEKQSLPYYMPSELTPYSTLPGFSIASQYYMWQKDMINLALKTWEKAYQTAEYFADKILEKPFSTVITIKVDNPESAVKKLYERYNIRVGINHLPNNTEAIRVVMPTREDELKIKNLKKLIAGLHDVVNY